MKIATHNPQNVARVFNTKPPQDFEAECALLGSMMLDPRVIGDVLMIIRSPEDLYLPKHAALYEVITRCYDHNPSSDLVFIRSDLDKRGMLEQVGGLDYLITLSESVPHAGSAVHYAKIVRDRAQKRELVAAGMRIVESAHGPDDAADLLERAEAAVYAIADKSEADGPMSASDALQATYDRLQANEGQRPGVMTGFYDLDQMTNGFQPGQLIIVAARPGMGKTSFAMQIGLHAAMTDRVPVAFFSLEMTREELGVRLMAHEAGVPLNDIRTRRITAETFEKLALSVGRISECPMRIDDTPGLSLMQLRARARRLVTKHDIQMLIVDYLQLMTTPDKENRVQEVSALSRGLKLLARELKIPVMCLSQLNRQSIARKDNKPKMSDLRESGSIEQDADAVLLIHREDYHNLGDDHYTPTNEVMVLIEKQRQGATGVVHLLWDGPTVSMKNAYR